MGEHWEAVWCQRRRVGSWALPINNDPSVILNCVRVKAYGSGRRLRWFRADRVILYHGTARVSLGGTPPQVERGNASRKLALFPSPVRISPSAPFVVILKLLNHDTWGDRLLARLSRYIRISLGLSIWITLSRLKEGRTCKRQGTVPSPVLEARLSQYESEVNQAKSFVFNCLMFHESRSIAPYASATGVIMHCSRFL